MSEKKKEKPGFLDDAKEALAKTFRHDDDKPDTHELLSKPEPKVTVKINEVTEGGGVLTVWTEVDGEEIGVPFHASDIEKLPTAEAKREYIARQVKAAAAVSKPKAATPAAYRELLGTVTA